MADWSNPLTRRSRYSALESSLWKERSSFDSHWRELSDFMMPRRSRFVTSDRNKGGKSNSNIINSTARFAWRTLQSGLHAGLTSPARPWFKLTLPDPELAGFKPVREWLHEVTQRMMVFFSGSNLYNTLPIVYGDMGGFGTAAMALLEDDKDLFRCYAYPLGSYALGLDRRNMVTTFVRRYQLTVRQLVQEFGVRRGYRDIDWTNISQAVKTQWESGNYENTVDLCWVVTPNEQHDPSKPLSRYLPWASCHYEVGSSNPQFLRESGYRSFPIMAPRWDVTGEDSYGTDCPGMTALGDVRQLQLMERSKAKAIIKQVDPPLVGSHELRTQKTSLLSGDITYVREPDKHLKAIHDVNLNLGDLTYDMSRVEYRIQRAFFEDLFLMLARADQQRDSGQPITAREVEERHEEKLLALGPVLERTNDELLDPIIDRVFEMMVERKLVPPAPPEIEDVDLEVEYVSIMAQAQKMVGVAGQDRFLSTVGPLVESFPDVVHKINVMRVVDNYGDMLGVDPRIIRSDEDVEERLEQQAAVARNQAAAEQAQLLGRAVKDAATAPMGTDSALDRIAAAMPGQ